MILTEEKPKISHDNFEYFLNQAFAPFAILKGRNFVFTFANEAYRELMNGRQLVGKPLDEAIPELKDQPFMGLLETVFKTGVPFQGFEVAATAVFKGNTEPTTRYFNLNYTPYKTPNGETEGILASGYDITEQVELKMKDEKHVLNVQAYNLFMQAPVGFSLMRGDDHILELVNATGLAQAGKEKEIIGKPIAESLPGIERQGYIDLLDKVKHGGETFDLKEYPVTLIKNGKEETMYVNIIYQPYYEGENIAGVLSITNNVTEQVLARKEAEELRERFETMANHIPNLAWIANADGWIFWYNSRWYDYTGTTPEQMAGWGWKSVHDPETLPAVLERWQSSINSGQFFEMVFPIKGADGVYHPFLTRVVPIRNSKGEIIRWLGTNTDITKQKEVERMKDDFLAMASHELKTPVTTIKAYGQIAESLLAKKGDTQVLGMIEKMGKQVNRLTTLIEDLLDVTKIQTGKFLFTETLFDFHELVIEIIDDMQTTNASHNISCNSCVSAKVFGDRDKVGQVLNNLVSNAIKYSPKADKIVIKTQVFNGGIQLSIQDFGIGIALQDQKNVFDQFYRVNGENQSTFPGMGIGLYICSEIMKRHGGKIWIDSVVGKGSTFYIWLPLDHRL